MPLPRRAFRPSFLLQQLTQFITHHIQGTSNFLSPLYRKDPTMPTLSDVDIRISVQITPPKPNSRLLSMAPAEFVSTAAVSPVKRKASQFLSSPCDPKSLRLSPQPTTRDTTIGEYHQRIQDAGQEKLSVSFSFSESWMSFQDDYKVSRLPAFYGGKKHH